MDAVFSGNGEYLATKLGEQLKIWEVASNSLFQEFFAGESINCINWSHVSEGSGGAGLSVCAGVGAQVVEWSLAQGQRTATLEGQHSGEVKCLACTDGRGSGSGTVGLLSGGDDGHIVHWSSSTKTAVKKWKAFKSCVHSLCCHGDVLLSAGRMVKVWHMSDYSLIKKLPGHSTAVSQLVAMGDEHFLSVAADDRVINMWSCDGSNRDAVCSLVCDESAVGVVCSEAASAMNVAVLCEAGKVQLFQVFMDTVKGKTAAALSAQSTLQYVASAKKGSTPSPLAVLCLLLCEGQLRVAYGSLVRPVVESLAFDISQKHQCLLRQHSVSGLLLPSGRRGQTRGSAPSMTVVGPGNMATTSHQVGVKTDHRPLTERLQEKQADHHDDGKTAEGKRTAQLPSTESLGQLLAQAITSSDDKLLEQVLRVSKEKMVHSTVKKLPVHLVLAFMNKLIALLRQSPARGLEISVWMKCLLTCHSAYLMTVPDLPSSVSGLYEVLEARVASFSKLCALQGKLNFLIAHAAEDEGGMAAAQVALNTPAVTITLGESYPAEHDVAAGDSVQDWSDHMESDSEGDSESSMDS